MKTKNLDISIIIVNYNTKHLLLNCLNSIYEYTEDITFEVIVVDNASMDDSVAFVRKQFPNVKILESNSNLGFGKANNRGAEIAQGDYLFFLNSDTLLIENSVKKLYDFFNLKEREFNIGVLGCTLFDASMKISNSGGFFPKVNKYIANYAYKFLEVIFKLKKDAYSDIIYDNITSVDMVSGADMFMKNKLFNLIGGFDERYFLYYEETDLQYRLSKLGFKNYITDSTKIIHLEGGSLSYNNTKRIIIKSSQNLYFKLNEKKFYFKYVLFEILITPFLFFLSKYSFKEQLIYIKNNFRTLL